MSYKDSPAFPRSPPRTSCVCVAQRKGPKGGWMQPRLTLLQGGHAPDTLWGHSAVGSGSKASKGCSHTLGLAPLCRRRGLLGEVKDQTGWYCLPGARRRPDLHGAHVPDGERGSGMRACTHRARALRANIFEKMRLGQERIPAPGKVSHTVTSRKQQLAGRLIWQDAHSIPAPLCPATQARNYKAHHGLQGFRSNQTPCGLGHAGRQ